MALEGATLSKFKLYSNDQMRSSADEIGEVELVCNADIIIGFKEGVHPYDCLLELNRLSHELKLFLYRFEKPSVSAAVINLACSVLLNSRIRTVPGSDLLSSILVHDETPPLPSILPASCRERKFFRSRRKDAYCFQPITGTASKPFIRFSSCDPLGVARSIAQRKI